MKSHRFDPVSFVFGVLFLTMAGYAVAWESTDSELGQWLWPAALITIGVGLLASALRRRNRGRT